MLRYSEASGLGHERRRCFGVPQHDVVRACLLICLVAAGARGATATISTVHRDRVPHTDRNGHRLDKYDPKRSFFPIGIWGMVLPDGPEGKYIAWTELAKANFNTVWPTTHDDRDLSLAQEAGLQLVIMGKISDDVLAKVKDHPNLLGNMWTDEPTARLGSVDMDALFREFEAYKKKLNAAAPGLPIFVNDPPSVTPPHRDWFIKWNSAGDVTCQDIYPLIDRKARTRTLGADPDGMPQVVALANEINKGAKPVWTIVDAFQHPHDREWPYRFPTPMQMRAQVYAAIVSGATGIAYFTFDSWPMRSAGIVAISPDPRPSYRDGAPAWTNASPLLLVQAKALWETTKQINGEIKELTPALLSPTVGDQLKYSVEVQGESVTPSPLRCMLKPHPAGGYVLMAVNVDDAVLEATVSIPTPIRSIEVMYENRTAPTLEGSKFSDHFEPFDVHVYRIKPPQGAAAVGPK